MLRTGVAVEKLSSRKTAEIRSRQEVLRTISPPRLDIFYHPNFGFLRKKRVFSTATGFITPYLISRLVVRSGFLNIYPDRFVVSIAGEAYDAQTKSLNRKFQQEVF